MVIRNPYFIEPTQYRVNLSNQVEISIQNIRNVYIQTMQGIVQCLKFFLILCTGDNINIEQIKATDLLNRNYIGIWKKQL